VNRTLAFFALAAFVAANVAVGWVYQRHLHILVAHVGEETAESPQAQLRERRAELEQLQRAVNDYEQRAGVTLADAMQLFETAAVGWTEIVLESSPESESARRLDIVTVKGLAGTAEQLSRVDKRLAPRCRSYRRLPTREGSYVLSCQVKPLAFRWRD